jgi:hypothetical protein
MTYRRNGAVVEVQAESLASNTSQPLPASHPFRGVPQSFFRFLKDEGYTQIDDLLILCVGNGQVLTVRVRDFDRFEHEYWLDFPYEVGASSIARDKLPSGVRSDQIHGQVAVADFTTSRGTWSMTMDSKPPRFSLN